MVRIGCRPPRAAARSAPAGPAGPGLPWSLVRPIASSKASRLRASTHRGSARGPNLPRFGEAVPPGRRRNNPSPRTEGWPAHLRRTGRREGMQHRGIAARLQPRLDRDSASHLRRTPARWPDRPPLLRDGRLVRLPPHPGGSACHSEWMEGKPDQSRTLATPSGPVRADRGLALTTFARTARPRSPVGSSGPSPSAGPGLRSAPGPQSGAGAHFAAPGPSGFSKHDLSTISERVVSPGTPSRSSARNAASALGELTRTLAT